MQPETTEFIYRTVGHTVVQWYKDAKGDVMATNAMVIERIAEHGEQPPGFCSFRGEGIAECNTVLGPRHIKFHFDIPDAADLQDAASKMAAAEEVARPGVIEQAKEEAVQEFEALRRQIHLPGGPGMPGMPGAPGPRIIGG